MNRFNDPAWVWDKYQNGMSYKSSLSLQKTVEENENFYIGKQWEGVNAPDLDKPVLNILGRVISYFIAMISTDAIGVSCNFFNLPTADYKDDLDIIKSQIEQFIEDVDLNDKTKDVIRAAAIDGDVCLHNYFDPDAPTGQTAAGLLKCEMISNLDVVFGNRYSRDKESQPYIILAARKRLEEVKEEMKRRGRPKDEIDAVTPDDNPHRVNYGTPMTGDEMVTELTCYHKQNGTVWATKTTQAAIVQPDTDLGYRLYPLSWMSWETVRDSYHGRAAVTGLIPNQIAINKLFAMAIKFQRELAFPKLLVDRSKIPKWDNRIGVIEVSGDPNEAVAKFAQGGDMPPQVMQVIESMIEYTRDLMGASDAALGNVRPDNTSAIIAVQQATAIPLEIQRRAYKRMVEDVVRSALDIITADYGVRAVLVADDLGTETVALYDFSTLRDRIVNMKVDIGASAFWSELTQVKTLDNLFQAGIIDDALMYLEALPENQLPGKNKLIAQIRQRREEQASVMPQMQTAPAALPQAGGVADTALPQMQTML